MKKALAVLLLLIVLSLLRLEPVQAASPSFTIYANSGSASAEQGCFTTSPDPNCNGPADGDISVTQGDSVSITFVVPSNDPYCCGAQVTGDGGQFDTGNIAKGGSKKVTFSAGSSFNFTSYWPNNSLVKAHGSVTVTAPAPQPPATPTGLKATALSTSQIRLTWNSAQGATSYKVERNGAIITTVGGTEFTNSGLQADTTYTYRVIAANSDGNSAPSSAASAKTHAQKTTQSSNTDGGDESDTEESDTKKALFVDERNYYVEIDGKTYGLSDIPDVGQGQTLIVYGKTVADAKITLSVDGKQAATATANKEGAWNAEIKTSELALGRHKTEIALSHNGDSATDNFEFTVTDTEAAMQDQQNTVGYEASTGTRDDTRASWLLFIGITAAGATLAGGGTFYWLKRRKLPVPSNPSPQPAVIQPGDTVNPDEPDPNRP